MTIGTLRVARPVFNALLAGVLAAGVWGCREHVDRGPEAPSDLNAREAGFPINDSDFARIGYRRDWLGFPNVAGGARITNVALTAEAVYVQDSGSTVTALELGTGQRRWSDQLSTQLTRYVALAPYGNRLLACSDYEVNALRIDNGDVISRQRYSKVVNTAPIIVADRAVFGTASGDVIAHGLGLGFQAWACGTGSPISRNPVSVEGLVGVVNDVGEVYFFEPLSGSIAGRSRAMYAGCASNPIAAGDMLIAASLDQSLYAFRPSSSRPVWQYRSSAKITGQPAFHNGQVLCEVEGSLMAFDAATGKPNWTAQGTPGEVVAVREGKLLVRSGPALLLMDPARGEVMERISVPGMLRVIPDKFEDGSLFITSTTGLLAKFNTR